MNKLTMFLKRYAYLLFLLFLVIGLFDLRFAIAAIVCMIAPVLVSLFKGRFWCGNLCPRGSFYDNIVSKFSHTRKPPAFVKSIYFRIIIMFIMLSMFGFGTYSNWGDPFGIGMVFYRMIVITSAIGLMLSFFFTHRTWCSFCPMGTFSSWIAKARQHKNVLYVSSSCVNCNLCEKKCPLGIVPKDYQGNILSHPDCIQCNQCVTICPKNAIGYNKN